MNIAVKTPAALFAVKRKTNSIALKNVSIVKEKGLNKIGINPNENPYNRKYMPDLIDFYPPNDDIKPSIALVNNKNKRKKIKKIYFQQNN